MIILLHTSKTMRPANQHGQPLQTPELRDKAKILAEYLKTLTPRQIAATMHVSPKLADKTHELIAGWNDDPASQRPAIDSFIGDIYSGLQVPDWSASDRSYADSNLRILSGLYGILRPLDGIYPYRLEMGYRLPKQPFSSLYGYWGDAIAKTLPSEGPIINLAAVEYSKSITAYADTARIISPTFLTRNPKTKEPAFVVVHTKIARGAFAAWLIKNRISKAADLARFNELGYIYDKAASTPKLPVFVCKEFGGLGLSIRLT